MSYERCFGGFAGHNVDRRLWGIAVLRQEPLGRQGCAEERSFPGHGRSTELDPERTSHGAVQVKGRIRAALINLQLLRHPRSEPDLYDAARFPSTINLTYGRRS